MEFNKLKERPFVLYVLQILCILITINKLLTTNFHQTHMQFFSLTYLLPIFITILWILTSIGFLTLKKWGWGLFIGLLYFNIFILINKLLFNQLDFSLGHLIPILIGIIIICLMNKKSVFTLYKIGNDTDKQLSIKITNFSILCIFLGFFLISEPIILGRLTSSSIVSQLYVLIVGFILIMIGIGLWNAKKIAFFSAQPLLLFICLSATYILIKDLMSDNNAFSYFQVLFYISINWIMYTYWSFSLKSKSPVAADNNNS